MSRALGRVLVCVFMGLVMVAIFGVRPSPTIHAAEDQVVQDAQQTILEGRRTFRFDTFGDQQFWGDTLHLHEAVEGAKFGGVGPGLSPQTALALGLKVDSQALPLTLQQEIAAGQVNLADPATTLALLKLQAVIGLTGYFNPMEVSSRSAFSAPYATRPWTIRSPRASASGWTVGPTAT